MAAHQTLTLVVLVRVQHPQPNLIKAVLKVEVVLYNIASTFYF